MFYGNNIQDTRRMFFVSWLKYRQKQPLQPIEKQLVAVIIDHPEYHSLLESPAKMAEPNYSPELGQTNPFLHMGLHLAVRDQVSTDRPVGISQIYKKLLAKYNNSLTVEHLIIDFLAECLWQAQRTNCAPDEKNYLLSLEKLI